MKYFSIWILVGLLYVPPAHAERDGPPDVAQPTRVQMEQNVQAWIGVVSTDDNWSNSDPVNEEPLVGDIGTLPYLGGASQRLWGGALQAGFEGGGLVTWKNDSTSFYATNNTLRVKVDNTLWSVEVFFGGVLSVRPVPWLRLYGAAGPTVAYAHLDGDNDDPSVQPVGSNVNYSSGGGSVSLTLYGRAGFEFETPHGFTFGAHARYANHEFDFDDNGKLKLDNVQYFLSFGQRL